MLMMWDMLQLCFSLPAGGSAASANCRDTLKSQVETRASSARLDKLEHVLPKSACHELRRTAPSLAKARVWSRLGKTCRPRSSDRRERSCLRQGRPPLGAALDIGRSAEMSLGAADTSVRATSSAVPKTRSRCHLPADSWPWERKKAYAGTGCGTSCLCLHSPLGHCKMGPAFSHFSIMYGLPHSGHFSGTGLPHATNLHSG